MLESVDLEQISKVFKIYEARDEGDIDLLYGEPLVEANIFHGTLYPYFSEKNRTVRIEHSLGEYVVTIKPVKKDKIWINVVLALATICTTTVAGAMLYGVDPFAAPLDIYKGLPFSFAIMLVLGSHELSHYIASRRHGVDSSLPYFIPFPLPPIGTMGAVIRQKGPVPTRQALFDVGISGPLVGLLVAIAVTIFGLMLPLQTNSGISSMGMSPNAPLLFGFLLDILHPGATVANVDPIAFAGWVGMLVTMLNLIPVGQLDGGHVSRAVFGQLSDRISRYIPLCLMAIGLYGTFALNQDGEIWILWGLITSFMSSAAHPKPTDDTRKVGMPRIALACATVALALLCFTPFPFSLT
ncbi:MAG TPA: site-2 protease family protein [Methanocella sp.]|jgi:membrane-associated protease RseP (regulator of RpoE activity)